jgi:CRISPR-associated protein Csx10
MNGGVLGTSNARLLVHMRSDWHVGTGAGRPGDVDAAVVRDTDGFPCIPAKTLIGIWRDRCEAVAGTLGEGWVPWVTALFGGVMPPAPPRSAAVEVRPARLALPLRQALAQPDAAPLKDALTFVQPGVRLDRQTGAAMDDHLRFVEVVRGGLQLEAEVCLRCSGWSAAQVQTGLALLLAGLASVEHLGGDRRRGRGECALELRAPGLPEQACWLQWLLQPPAPIPATERGSHAARGTRSSPQAVPHPAAWVRVPLEFRAETPVVVQAQARGNLVTGQTWVPGTYLLPTVARALEAVGIDATEAIRASVVQVLPAVPASPRGPGRPAPTPLSWRKPKEGQAQCVANALLGAVPRDQRYVRARFPFVLAVGQRICPVELTLRRQSHAAVEDEAQRPTSAVGGVYTYESIPAGTVLRGELRIRQDLWRMLGSDWPGRLPPTVRWGRSKKDDYGLVALTVHEPVPADPTTAPEVAGCAEDVPELGPGDVFSVWLLSPALLRGESLWAEPTPQALMAALEAAWGVRLRCYGAAYARVWRQDGWQTAWGLPRPSLVGLDAGSCLRLQVVAGTVSPAAAARVLWEGIGERRVEGFGQLALEHPLLARERWDLDPAAASGAVDAAATTIPPDASSRGVLRVLERVVWRGRLLVRAAEEAADEARRQKILGLECGVGRSQANLLRARCTQLRTAADVAAVLQWAEKTRTSAAAARWPSQVWDKLCLLLEDDANVWTWLQREGSWPTATPDGAVQLRQELWAEAIRALVGACVEAHVRAVQARGEGDRGGA